MRMTIFVTLLLALSAVVYAQSTSPISPGAGRAERAIGTPGGALPANVKLVGAKNGATVVPLEVDASNALKVTVLSTVSTTPVGKLVSGKVRNDYTGTPVTTLAYVELFAALPLTTELEIFDSSGQTLVLAFGAAGFEVDTVHVVPGGNGRIPLAVPAGTRVSVKAVSANATAGEITVNAYN